VVFLYCACEVSAFGLFDPQTNFPSTAVAALGSLWLVISILCASRCHGAHIIAAVSLSFDTTFLDGTQVYERCHCTVYLRFIFPVIYV
jgi:hypothetical protein